MEQRDKDEKETVLQCDVHTRFLRRAWVSAGGHTWVSPTWGGGRRGCSAVRDKVLSKSLAGHETIHPREAGRAEAELRLRFSHV